MEIQEHQEQWESGVTLDQCMKGDIGVKGNIGPVGSKGTQGDTGFKGQKGGTGPMGPPGMKGDFGVKGNNGPVGSKGTQGDTGLKGQKGGTGAAGSPAAVVGGVTYHRWGKSTCRSGATLVYGGKTGSSFTDDRGGASNYVCMPNEPQYTLRYLPGVQGYSYVYGTEYEYAPPGYNVNNHNAPCAVCYVATKLTTIMIPAHTSCPTGWTREYYGYLASERRIYHRTAYVCVDVAMESVPGSFAHIRGGHFHFVEAHCNGVSCLPYSNEKELGCVVCSK